MQSTRARDPPTKWRPGMYSNASTKMVAKIRRIAMAPKVPHMMAFFTILIFQLTYGHANNHGIIAGQQNIDHDNFANHNPCS